MPKSEELQELKPSEKVIIKCGPARVPGISDTCGIAFPNLLEILYGRKG